MKRRDLTVGQTYETAQGETIIVMDDRPFDIPSRSYYSTRPRRLQPTFDGKGSGVAVAKRSSWTRQGEQPSWEPAVRTLSNIRPLGTEQAKRDANSERWAKERQVSADQSAHCRLLASQLGVSEYAISWSAASGYRVDSSFVAAVERMVRDNSR